MAKPTSPTGLNATSASVLGLLALEHWPRPWTSYELAKQSRRSLSWFWPRAQRRLLAVPKDLVKLGYSTSELLVRGKRRTPHYTITKAGRSALRAWLAEEGSPVSIEVENLIRVFFADQTDVGQLRASIQQIAQHAIEDRKRLSDVASDMDEGAIGGRAAVNALSIRLISDIHRAVENWANWAEKETATWQTTTEPWAGAKEVFREVIERD